MALRTLILFFTFAVSANEPIIRSTSRIHPNYASHAMVVSQDSFATKAAIDILKKGGTAADAAVALAYVLAVTQPKAGNIGGGGFALYYDAETSGTTAIDFRETAPAKAFKELFLDKDGKVDSNKSRFSLNASGIPGTVAGLEYIRATFGKFELAELMVPAIQLADKGFPVSAGLAFDLNKVEKVFRSDPYLENIYFKNDKILSINDLLIQKDLAKTLAKISQNGSKEFYEGKIAEAFVEYFKKDGGLISKDDLANYKVKTYQPVKGMYRGYEVLSMPPPSSGGVHLIQMLNILEKWDLKTVGHNSAEYIHKLCETMKLAYADRSLHLGDPAFTRVPVKGLISKKYASQLRKGITEKARKSALIKPGKPQAFESPETTHFSIIDQYGNAISLTYTINFSFGSRKVISGLGFFLNNEMDDFSAKTGATNAYGLIGSDANSIEPGKRPLSSMTPVIVLKENQPWLITGSPGGSRIITSVLQVVLNVIDHDMNIAEATMAPRVHHQWLPDLINLEMGISPDTISLLKSRGHKVKTGSTLGCTESILIENGLKYGFADPRRIDASAQGY